MSDFVEVKTSELSGAALDWAVAVSLGYECGLLPDGSGTFGCNTTPPLRQYVIGPLRGASIAAELNARFFRPSTDWANGGPFIDEHGIEFKWLTDATIEAYSYTLSEKTAIGGTHLEAAGRLLAMELGDTVKVPADLI